MSLPVTPSNIHVRVAFLVQLPAGVSPGQRFRCENWLSHLHEQKIATDYFPFFNEATYRILYQPGNFFKKWTGTMSGFLRRFLLLFKMHLYDFIFIQREAAPVGPPVFEWIICKLLKKQVIFDFDDAIWIPQQSNKWVIAVKCYWKIRFILGWSAKVVAGNEYLAQYALQYNSNTLVIPTVVDTQKQHNKQKEHSENVLPVVGWTGSHSTLKYLEQLLPVLEKVYQQHPFQLLVIADRPPVATFSNLQFIKWNAATEIDDLLQMDIGIMPLENDKWSEGKCGFKIIQYMALGIPAIASNVGVNKQIIEHGENGFLCDSDTQWMSSLITLLVDANKRQQFGNHGRKKIKGIYSIKKQLPNFLSVFQ